MLYYYFGSIHGILSFVEAICMVNKIHKKFAEFSEKEETAMINDGHLVWIAIPIII